MIRLLAYLSLLAVPNLASAQDCRLALLLALDISSSVSQDEDELQRTGLAMALNSALVQDAFLANPSRYVALSVIEWSGSDQQSVLLDWVFITSPATLAGAAETVANSARSYDEYPTALGFALGYAHTHFRSAPSCTHQTLDVSGDGLSNHGFNTEIAYDTYDYSQITVNGLVIGDEPGLLRYYRQEVIRGPGAFVQQATDYQDYQHAMERKLRRELGLAVAQTNSVQTQ